MKKIMLIGRTGSGKTTLTQILNEEEQLYRKTQDIHFTGNVIDTPGEYVEIKGYYRALIVSASECDIVGFVQDARDDETMFPPFFAETLNRAAIGIITKSDLVEDTSNAERILKNIGIEDIFSISSKTMLGIEKLKFFLGEL
ncbi:MAG: EutP/PduV family microcompartment system protein [Fusobacteriaceae bacterium]